MWRACERDEKDRENVGLKMDRGVGGGEIQVENGKQKRDGMKLWEFAFEEKNFLLFDSVRVSRGLGG